MKKSVKADMEADLRERHGELFPSQHLFRNPF